MMATNRIGASSRIAFPLAAVLAVALAACTSSRSTGPSAKAEIDPSTASQVNISSLTAVVNQNPSDASAYNVRGTAYGKAGKLNEALADFDKAIQINPAFYQAYANRALVHRRKGRSFAAAISPRSFIRAFGSRTSPLTILRKRRAELASTW